MKWRALSAVVVACACSRPSSVVAPSIPPAKVDGAMTEARVPVVTLTQEAERRLGLTVTAVTEREIGRRRTLPGVARLAAGGRAMVVAPVAARLEAPRDGKTIIAGAEVSNGQELWKLVLLHPDAGLQRNVAGRDLAAAQATLDNSMARQRRAEQLLADQSGSVRAVEEAKLAVALATAALADAKARIAIWDGSLFRPDGTLLLSSPLSGVVLACDVVPGQVVSPGAVLAEVGVLDLLWIHVSVHAAEVAEVDTHAPARIRALGELESHPWTEAPVAAAPPAADTSSGMVELVYQLSLGEHTLRPGQRVLAMVALRDRSKRLVVPQGSIVRDAYGGSWVYVRRDEHSYARRRVEVAWIDGTDAVLGEGPVPGAEVVTAGTTELFGAEFGQGK